MGSAVYPDRTTCFCCSVALVHWTKDHDPQREHEKRSPTCGFVTGYYQKFHNEQVRLESFSNWPLGADYCAVPDKLAKAGFYQQNTSQYSDRCVCFCCGIALVKWERGDDPWSVVLIQDSNVIPRTKGLLLITGQNMLNIQQIVHL